MERHTIEGCTVELNWTGRTNTLGKCRVEYRLIGEDGTVVFEGDDFFPSPQHSCDGEDAAYSLLGFLTMRPGEVEDEYFEDHTEAQLTWLDTDEATNLRLACYDRECAESD